MRKSKNQKNSIWILFKEILPLVIIVLIICLICFRWRPLNSNNTIIIIGDVTDVYSKLGGFQTPWRVYFTVSGTKCCFTANTKRISNKKQVDELVEQLKTAQLNRQTVTVWTVEHAEFLINRLYVQDCKTVVAIESETVSISMDDYNKDKRIDRISFSILFGCAFLLRLGFFVFIHTGNGSKKVKKIVKT